MRLFLLACLGLGLVAAAREMWCVPGDCKLDSNCQDSIHPTIDGRCCGGKCVRSDDVSSRKRLIGERCAPVDLLHPDNYEQCFADCATGLFCNTVDEICHAKRGVNCSCLADRECLSGFCRDSHVCGGTNLAFGETCERSDECASGICENNKCFAYAKGEYCSSSSQCVPDAICRRNTTSSFTYCLSPCAVGEENCCFVSGSSACATTPANLECYLGNNSCHVPPPFVPPPVPDLDEPCTVSCRNSTTMVCAYPCNATTGCESQRVCQLKNQVEIGDECDGGVTYGQCVVGASCSLDFSSFTYICTASPTSAPTGSPTPRVLNSVPLGQPCGSSLNYDLCQAPGNMCELNQTGYFVCKQSGATPIGAFCSRSSLSRDVRALDECVQGSRCTRNETFGSTSYCAPRIPIGQRCYSTNSYREYSYPECENGWDSCAMTGRTGCFGSCSGNDYNGNPCCTCIVPRSVPDGKNCSATKECQRTTSVCFTENRTCGNMQGVDCLSAGDCRDASFDCSCDRKCYVLNPPTPSDVSLAPTASTRAPSPYPPSRCATQQKAWEQMILNMSSSFTSWSGFPYTLTYANFHNNFVPQLLKLTESEQATAIGYVCCYSCSYNERFNSQIYKGYQVDCAARRLIKLEDTCNDLRGHWAMANCWGAVSAAPTLDMRLGFVLATFLVASL